RLFLASTPGWIARSEEGDGAGPTLEDVAAHWEAINAEEGYTVPADLVAWSRTFLDHLPPPG
ncbi:MAG TPA: short-chain dehydrogenase, partial [Deltaproteobacteria bacterium]|nr:short-chain dehydrogenase [Deltaproteobacteria bacterium]